MVLKAALTLVSAVVAAVSAALHWRRRRSPARRPLALVMAASAAWALAEVAGDSRSATIRGIADPALMPVGAALTTGVLWYALLLSGRTRWLTPRVGLLAAIEPVLITVLSATNRWHQLVVVDGPAGRRPGPLFWAHTVYAYGLLLVAVVLLVYTAMRSVPGHRRVVLMVLVSMTPPIVGNVVSVRFEAQNVDITGAMLLVTATLWLWIERGRPRLTRTPISTLQVLQALSDAILVVDEDGVVVEVNEAAVTLSGWSRSAILGRRWEEVVRAELPPMLRDAEVAMLDLPDGRHIDVRIRPVTSHGRRLGSVLVARDVTELERLRVELAEQAIRDPLTGLHNRRHLTRVIDRLGAEPPEHLVAVMLDVDHFKQVNDRYGHAVGDEVLVAIADELRHSVRADDVVARVGGEEFLLLLPGARVEDVVRRVEELRERCTHLQVPAAPDLRITLSAGVAELVADSPDIRQLLDRADRGVLSAKAAGRDRVVVVAA